MPYIAGNAVSGRLRFDSVVDGARRLVAPASKEEPPKRAIVMEVRDGMVS